MLHLGLGCCAGAASEGVALAGTPAAAAPLSSRELEAARRDGESVHVRQGETSNRCDGPVMRDRPAKPSDLHRGCTRATHSSVFEAALGRPVPVEVVETLRRGGKTCHFVARLA